MFCSKCGKEVKEGMFFCQDCGNPVNSQKAADLETIKNVGGSFLRSLQEKAKSVGESINTAVEEAQKKAEEEEAKKLPKIVLHTGKQEGRFKEDKFSNGLVECDGSVIVDRFTGVNYLFVKSGGGYAGGLTVLVDENGKPLVTKEDIIKVNGTGEE